MEPRAHQRSSPFDDDPMAQETIIERSHTVVHHPTGGRCTQAVREREEGRQGGRKTDGDREVGREGVLALADRRTQECARLSFSRHVGIASTYFAENPVNDSQNVVHACIV